MGPGTPDAPPWETLYRDGGKVLFGQPTFDMKKLFTEQGYKVGAATHQFEDHIGFELLYVALRYAEHGGELSNTTAREITGFIYKHPLSFLERMQNKAEESCRVKPGAPGYYPALLALTRAILLLEV
ncbi:MAG TPA: hypothetical protein DEB24_04375 [Coriobacteriia bacterium]|nr:hypothetical protein [Coriobacteriia bacterium]